MRAIELGRAVLALPSQNIELWLTTLITISPQQHSINLQQYTPNSLLEILSSGMVWVGRGNGMSIEIKLTLGGEPLIHNLLHDLTERIINAPVWDQLNLKLSVPINFEPHDGKARFTVRHTDDEILREGTKRYRLYQNVSGVDVQPPPGFPSVALDTVHFAMDFIETKQRAPSKRPKISSGDWQAYPRGRDASINHVQGFEQHVQKEVPAYLVMLPEDLREASEEASKLSTKSDLPFMAGGNVETCSKDYRNSSGDSSGLLGSERLAVGALVDGALRLSASGGIGKSSNGLKVKANTFRISLADVAPILWRPGCLQAIAQRALLLPTISRSIVHSSITRVTSVSLREKARLLNARQLSSTVESQRSSLAASSYETGANSTSVIDQLWLHLQKTASSRSAPGLQPFVTSGEKAAVLSESRDISEVTSSGKRQNDAHEFDSGSNESRLCNEIAAQQVSTDVDMLLEGHSCTKRGQQSTFEESSVLDAAMETTGPDAEARHLEQLRCEVLRNASSTPALDTDSPNVQKAMTSTNPIEGATLLEDDLLFSDSGHCKVGNLIVML